METFRLWSFSKVLLVSGGWILFCVLLAIAWLLFQFRDLWTAPSAGSGGIGAVSVGVGLDLILLLILLGPPIVLMVVWFIARWS